MKQKMSLQQIKRRNPRCRISAVTIDPIDPTCFIMFRIIPKEESCARGNFEARGRASGTTITASNRDNRHGTCSRSHDIGRARQWPNQAELNIH